MNERPRDLVMDYIDAKLEEYSDSPVTITMLMNWILEYGETVHEKSTAHKMLYDAYFLGAELMYKFGEHMQVKMFTFSGSEEE